MLNITVTNGDKRRTALQHVSFEEVPGVESIISSYQYYDQYEHLFGTNIENFANITSWIGKMTEAVFDNHTYYSSQGASFANIMQWATLADGLYHPDMTYRGVTAAISAIAHYVLMVLFS